MGFDGLLFGEEDLIGRTGFIIVRRGGVASAWSSWR